MSSYATQGQVLRRCEVRVASGASIRANHLRSRWVATQCVGDALDLGARVIEFPRPLAFDVGDGATERDAALD